MRNKIMDCLKKICNYPKNKQQQQITKTSTRRLKWKDCKLKVSLDYTTKTCLEETNNWTYNSSFLGS